MKRGALSWHFLTVAMISAASANQDSMLAVTRANNQFSFQLYDVIRKSSNDNLLVSPFSVSAVFAMLQAGAGGESSNSIRSCFHFPADDQLNSGYHALLQELRSVDNVTLETVNRIYPAEGYALNPQFSHTLKNYYAAEPQQLNYANNVEAAQIINDFVSNATHDKVQDLIQSSDLNPDTKLVLVNAIYFKGNWEIQFRKQNTRKEDFYVGENEQPIKVDMMNVESSMLYADIPELGAKAVSLPYSGSRLSMVILLPCQRFGLAAMEEKMKKISIEKILERMQERRIDLFLPKFKVESEFDLKESLTELGLGNLFSRGHADLSGVAQSSGGLFISKAIQKAFIEVNEEGSEAAAATAVIMETKGDYDSPILPAPSTYFYVDHPYLFVLVKHSTAGDLALFIGRVTRANQL